MIELKDEKIPNPVISSEVLEKLKKSLGEKDAKPVPRPQPEPQAVAKVGVNTNPPPPTKPPAPKQRMAQQAPVNEPRRHALSIEQRVELLEERMREMKKLMYKFRFIPMKKDDRRY